MAVFQFSPIAAQTLINNVDRLFQPSESQGGSILADQLLCKQFVDNPLGLEVELIAFDCTEVPTNRQKTTYNEKGDKMTMVNASSLQQRGAATIKVEGNEFKVSMHSVVALSFTEKPTQTLVGQVGDITVGRNAGSKWLSLRLPSSPSHEQVAKWAAIATKAPIAKPEVKL